jgi:hypothetical protein
MINVESLVSYSPAQPLFSVHAAQERRLNQRKDHKMSDEIDDRLWTEHGASFTAALRDLIDEVRIAFVRLHEFHWAAPWQSERPCRDI